MKKLLYRIVALSRWKYVWIALTLVLVINFIAFPYAGRKMKVYAPNGADPIDLQFSYTADEVYKMIADYGDQGRALYASTVFTIDLVYPIVYTALFVMLISLLLRKRKIESTSWIALLWIPFIAFWADILENTGIVTMLNRYPQQLDVVAGMTSVMSSIKWISIALIVLTILLLTMKRTVTK